MPPAVDGGALDVEFFGHLVDGEQALFTLGSHISNSALGSISVWRGLLALEGFVDDGAELGPEFIRQFDLNLLHWS
jgi:hypothetical protein